MTISSAVLLSIYHVQTNDFIIIIFVACRSKYYINLPRLIIPFLLKWEKVSNPTKYEDTCKMLFCCRAAGIDSQSLTYEKPYCRIGPYLVGMVLGYLLLHAKDWRLTSKVI